MKSFLVLTAVLCLSACSGSSTPTPAPAPAPVPGAPPTPTPAPTPVSVGCEIESTIAAGIATAVGNTLNCTNSAAIKSSILTAAGKADLCPAILAAHLTVASIRKNHSKTLMINEKGVVGDVACPLLVNALTTAGLGALPATWGCAGGTSTASITALVTTECEALITF